MTERKYAEGIRIFPPIKNAPSFVKGSIIITLNELVKFCKDNPDLLSEYKGEKQLKLQLAERKDGKGLNLSIDTYKKEEVKDDLPF